MVMMLLTLVNSRFIRFELIDIVDNDKVKLINNFLNISIVGIAKKTLLVKSRDKY